MADVATNFTSYPSTVPSSGELRYDDIERKQEIAEFVPLDIFITGHARHVLEYVIDVTLSSILSYVGVVSNILVLSVFYRQGYNDSTNVSMSAIAVWDFIKCLSGAIQRAYAPLRLTSEAYSISWENISTATLVYLISFSSYVSSVMAAYVAVERCLCVTLPFKVKSLLTPKTTLTFMLGISFIVFGAFFPIFFIYRIDWISSPKYNNATIAVYAHSEFYEAHHVAVMKYYNLIGIIVPTISFVVIVVSTAIIISRLKESSQFRAGNSTAAGINSTQQKSSKPQMTMSSPETTSTTTTMTSREKQVVKMLLVIIAVYVIALFPRITVYIAKVLVPDLYFLQKYHNLFMVIVYICLALDFANATVNLYIFLAMSTNFRATFRAMFLWQPATDQNSNSKTLSTGQ